MPALDNQRISLPFIDKDTLFFGINPDHLLELPKPSGAGSDDVRAFQQSLRPTPIRLALDSQLQSSCIICDAPP